MFHDTASLGVIHRVANWEVADETARLALAVTADDIGKEAWQQDDDSFWRLKDDSPMTWTQVGAGVALANDSVTNAKLANMATATVKGRDTAGTGDPEDLSMSELYAILKGEIELELEVAASDESTALTTGTAKITFYWPRNASVTEVFIGLTAQSTSGVVTVDVNKNGSTIFSANPSIDANEDTNLTGTAGTLTSTPLSFSKGDKITIDIDAAGTGAKGLKVIFLYKRA